MASENAEARRVRREPADVGVTHCATCGKWIPVNNYLYEVPEEIYVCRKCFGEWYREAR